MDATRELEEVSQLPRTWHFAFEKSHFPCFSPLTVEFQALVPGSIELHLLCHVTLLYCQVDPNPKPKAKSKAKKSLLPLSILPLMWQTTCSFESMLFIQLTAVPPMWFGPHQFCS